MSKLEILVILLQTARPNIVGDKFVMSLITIPKHELSAHNFGHPLEELSIKKTASFGGLFQCCVLHLNLSGT